MERRSTKTISSLLSAVGLTVLTPAVASATAFSPEGSVAPTPPGYAAFCERTAFGCARDRVRGVDPRAMSPAEWAILEAVNSSINRRIAPVMEKVDVWREDAKAGDCEDYALAKRAVLLDLGWNASQLLLAYGDAELDQPHAVLIARTEEGDFVLDNLTDQIVRWDEGSVRLTSRQSAELPLLWVLISD